MRSRHIIDRRGHINDRIPQISKRTRINPGNHEHYYISFEVQNKTVNCKPDTILLYLGRLERIHKSRTNVQLFRNYSLIKNEPRLKRLVRYATTVRTHGDLIYGECNYYRKIILFITIQDINLTLFTFYIKQNL